VVKIPDWRHRRGAFNLLRSEAATKPNIALLQSRCHMTSEVKERLSHKPPRTRNPRHAALTRTDTSSTHHQSSGRGNVKRPNDARPRPQGVPPVVARPQPAGKKEGGLSPPFPRILPADRIPDNLTSYLRMPARWDRCNSTSSSLYSPPPFGKPLAERRGGMGPSRGVRLRT
jgi:hypothetical protein